MSGVAAAWGCAWCCAEGESSHLGLLQAASLQACCCRAGGEGGKDSC